jgi:hypothetical protein
MAAPNLPPGFDFTDPDIYAQRLPGARRAAADGADLVERAATGRRRVRRRRILGGEQVRNPNPHLGFGGTGAHYCVGANLARMTIDLMFNAIADHIPDLTPIAAPERLRSSMINGIKHWQVAYTGSPR